MIKIDLDLTPKRKSILWNYDSSGCAGIVGLKTEKQKELQKVFKDELPHLNVESNDGLGMVLNYPGTMIWEQCDGLTTIKEMADSFMEEFHITRETAINLDCRHCIEGGTKEQQELTKNEIFDLIDDFKMLGVYRLVLTGGEPFCRKELTEIIKRCSDNCIKTIVFTNGTLLTEEILEKIKNENVLLRFSVDGATKEVHDAIRGAGNFEKTVKAMEMCKAKNIDIGISSTINTLNYNQYKDIVELADSLKVRELELSEMICEGNGRVNDGLLLDAGQLEQLRVYNLELANHNNSFRKGMGFGKQAEAFQKPEERKYSCNAGITTCFIGSDGEIFPCTLFKEYEEFSAGNIRENSLYDIWTRQEAFHNLRHLDINTIEKYKKCDCFNLCPGGCRAKAFMATRDLAGDMDDIFCQISIKMRQRMKNGEFNYVWQG